MKRILLSLLVASTLAACGDKDPAPAKVTLAQATMSNVSPNASPNTPPVPDVGKVEQVTVSSTGMGVTPGAAINDALKTAIGQVNGVRIESTSASLSSYEQATATLDVESSRGKDSAKASATLQSQQFADLIVAQSKGQISSFKVLKLTPPEKQGAPYAVQIEAQIAKFKAPVDNKIKIVVAPLHANTDRFNIGGVLIPANEILSAIRQQMIDSLNQTGRFTILDRQFEADLQNELDMIGAGKTVNTDFAKMGQALSADLVWVGIVNDLSYVKSARKLQTSDRELVSYAGGWSVSQRMINLATRQIQQSNTLQGAAPGIAPTTLGTSFNPGAIIQNMEDAIVKKAVEAILLRTFPISIAERDGNNVVLSQGGKALNEGQRYRVYLLGKEIKDPQTGQSLGNMENVCCEVVVNRVTPNLSYGVLENVQVDLASVKPGALQVREALFAVPQQQTVKQAADAPAATTAAAASTTKSAGKPKAAAAAKADKSEDW